MAGAAAAIGLVPSIISLIDLGVRMGARLHDFTSKTSEVPESFRSLEKRLPHLVSTLRLIQQQADTGRLSTDVSTALLYLTQSTFTHLKVVETRLSHITPSSNASRIRRIAKALQSLTKDSSIRAAEENIHQNIDQMLSALAQLQLGQVQPSSLTPGHTFGNVSAHDYACIQLGDVYHVHQHPAADAPKKFGLCLAQAPLIKPENFVGRARELEKMVQLLRPGEPAVEQRQVVLGGLGGMGKTQLAIAYARQHHASYTSVFWLNATSEDTLKASFRSIAEEQLQVSPTKKLDDEEVRKGVFGWLSDVENTQWLLIFDNYDEPNEFTITNYLPIICSGSVVVTTRLPDLVRGQRMPQLRVSKIENLDESLQILQSRSRREDVRHGEYALEKSTLHKILGSFK